MTYRAGGHGRKRAFTGNGREAMSGRYHIITYGCQMNVHESEKIAGILRRNGYETEVKSPEQADIIVFNTCCIRENAENHAYGNIGALKKLKKQRPELIIAVGGCMTQQKGAAETLHRKFPYVDIIFGTHNLEEFGTMLQKKAAVRRALIAVEEHEKEIVEEDISYRTSRPNAWVNIMYGCNNYCTYCVVPYVRGRERSRDPEKIVAEVNALLDDGYREITLLGQNVNSYGNDSAYGVTFPQLLRKICERKGKYRLRFMTSNPKDFGEELVDAIGDLPQVCNLVHLPAQAGSDRILSLMNRHYTAESYLEKVRLLRSCVPDAEITSDLMVGFPTETEEDFQCTLDLVREADFFTAFTFVYSPRRGTKAAVMEGQVPEEVKKERIMRLVEAVNANTREKTAKYLGKEMEILCEDYTEKHGTGLYLGRDEYGRMGYFESAENRIGSFVTLRVTDASGVSIYGEEADGQDG